MATNVRFPIRYKILAVLSAVVVAAVAFYLYLAAKLFYEDKTQLVYELNQTSVRTLALDVRTTLLRNLDKLKLVAGLLATDQTGRLDTIEAVFAGEDELVKVAVLEQKNPTEAPTRTFVQTWPKYLETYKRDATYLDRIRDTIPVPFEKVQLKGVWVRNVTLDEENAPPLMTIATVIESEGGSDAPKRVIYADVRLDRMLEAFAPGTIANTYAVDSEGKLLAHSEHELVMGGKDFTSDLLMQTALSSSVRSEVRRFDEGEKSYLGSFYQTGLAGIVIASKVETGAAFQAAERLIRKSLIYALVVVTAAFLIALFFAHSLTQPIQRLLEATQRVARGDFDRLINVSSHDELATLAASFNAMTVDLKSSRAQIEEYSRTLEKKVEERTHQLEEQNVAIKEAQEALVRTTRLASVGEVAGRAAHEVLNPLTNVSARLEKMQLTSIKADHDDLKLFADIIMAWTKDLNEKGAEGLFQGLKTPSQAVAGKTLLEEDLANLAAIGNDLAHRIMERQTDIDFLLKESSRINKIVNGMRQLTRVSGNKGPLDIHALLDETLATMNDVLKKRKITTETRFATGAPRVLADHDELLQVFSNLIRNSMQAIEEAQRSGGAVGSPPKIWFETELIQKEEGSRVLIRVCDNGPGISEENFQKVFEASFTTKTVEEGTGLGLSIARRFIRAFDGEIIVEKSAPGVQTAFMIDLPVEKTV